MMNIQTTPVAPIIGKENAMKTAKANPKVTKPGPKRQAFKALEANIERTPKGASIQKKLVTTSITFQPLMEKTVVNDVPVPELTHSSHAEITPKNYRLDNPKLKKLVTPLSAPLYFEEIRYEAENLERVLPNYQVSDLVDEVKEEDLDFDFGI